MDGRGRADKRKEVEGKGRTHRVCRHTVNGTVLDDLQLREVVRTQRGDGVRHERVVVADDRADIWVSGDAAKPYH